MFFIECLKQPAGLLQSLIILINHVSPLSGLHFANDDDFNLKESEDCISKTCTDIKECCAFYSCIDGVCSKPGSNIEFIILAKVSLEITFALLLAAIFIFLLRGLFNIICERYQLLGRQGNIRSLPSQLYTRQCHDQRPPVYDMRPDKPPSYEECVQTSQRGSVTDSPPPPYTISASLSSGCGETVLSSSKFVFDSQNMIPLDVQALGVVLGPVSEDSKKTKSTGVSEN